MPSSSSSPSCLSKTKRSLTRSQQRACVIFSSFLLAFTYFYHQVTINSIVHNSSGAGNANASDGNGAAIRRLTSGTETNHDPKNNAAATSTSTKQRECHRHVVLTTFLCRPPSCNNNPLRQLIENNTYQIWSTLPHVTFLTMNNHPPHNNINTNTNEYNMPIFMDMFHTAMEACPHAGSYSYINGDILATSEFVETLDALMLGDRYKLNGMEFLMIGTRTNVPWKLTQHSNDANDNDDDGASYDATSDKFNFDALFQKGKLFVSNAQDYFAFTRGALEILFAEKNNNNNNGILHRLVVGRHGYDNYLVDLIYHHSNITSIDATKTVRAMHQTDERGVYSWGDRGKELEANDFDYNRKLTGKVDTWHGNIEHATWLTTRDEKGRLVVRLPHLERIEW